MSGATGCSSRGCQTRWSASSGSRHAPALWAWGAAGGFVRQTERSVPKCQETLDGQRLFKNDSLAGSVIVLLISMNFVSTAALTAATPQKAISMP